MTLNQPTSSPHIYFVTVGHAKVDVKSTNPTDAIRQARRQLSSEYPRMWDVIQAMNDKEFTVILKD